MPSSGLSDFEKGKERSTIKNEIRQQNGVLTRRMSTTPFSSFSAAFHRKETKRGKNYVVDTVRVKIQKQGLK